MIRCRTITAVAASLALCACATAVTPPRGAGDVVDQASVTLDQVQADYDAAKAFVDLFLPLMPPARADQVRKTGAVVEDALRRARVALTAAQRLMAIDDARRAIASYQLVSGG